MEWFENIWGQVVAGVLLIFFSAWITRAFFSKDKGVETTDGSVESLDNSSKQLSWPDSKTPRQKNSLTNAGWVPEKLSDRTWKITWSGDHTIFAVEVAKLLERRSEQVWAIVQPPAAEDRTLDMYTGSQIIVRGPGGEDSLGLTWIGKEGRIYLTDHLL